MSSSNTDCPSGKVRHSSKGDALVAASTFTRVPKRKGGDNRPYKMRAYQCEQCGGWHITKRVRG